MIIVMIIVIDTCDW